VTGAASFVRASPASTYAVAGLAIAGDANRIEVVGIVVDVLDLYDWIPNFSAVEVVDNR
jgi:hypothetical protein